MDNTVDAAKRPTTKQQSEDNDAVAAQLACPAPLTNAQTSQPAAQPVRPRTLDSGLQRSQEATQLLTLIRATLFPAYRRAIDALDPLPALELARHVAGSLQVIEHDKQEILATLPSDDVHHYMVSIEGQPEQTEDQIKTKFEKLQAEKTALLTSVDALDAQLAVEIGPQMFRGKPVLGGYTKPTLGKDPVGYLTMEAGAAVELISVVAQVRDAAGAKPGMCPVLDAAQRQQIIGIVEPWKSRPVNFAFLVRVLQEEGIWDAVAHEPGKQDKTLEQTNASVLEQVQETGALADVGELDIDTLNGLFGIDRHDPLRFEQGPPAIDDDTAMQIFEKLRSAAPEARGPLIRQVEGMGELHELCSHLPWKYVEAIHDSVIDSDQRAAALLRPYFEGKGEGRSMHKIYMDEVEEDLDEGQEFRAFGWFFLDYLHNAFTAGFEHEYSDAYDAHEQGFTTDDQFSSQTTKALGKAAAIMAVSAVTGGVAGEFAEGVAAGLGASQSVAQIIGGGVGGFAAGVGGHFTGDVYDQLLNGKQGFDSVGSYMQSGAMGGAMGTVLSGVSVAAGKYLGAPRPIDSFAQQYPRMSRVLEDVRATGFRSGAAVKMKVGDLLDLIKTNFGGPGGPGAFQYAYAGGLRDVRTLPPETEIYVSMRPLRPLTQPMQMSTIGDKTAGDATSEGTTTTGTTEEQQVVAFDKVELAESGPDTPVNAGTADGMSMSPAAWLERLKAQLTAEEVTQYELMKGKWKTPEEMQNAFNGDFDAAKQSIGNAAAQKASGLAVQQASKQRATEIREWVRSRGVLEEQKVVDIVSRLSENPSKEDILQATRDLRTVLVGDLLAEENAARYPGARVLREVKVWEEQPNITAEQYRSLGRDQKQGLTSRRGENGSEHIFKDVTDIDALVVAEGQSGKLEILRVEQQKTGARDTQANANAQNKAALDAIADALAGKKTIRLETQGTDITDQLDLSTASGAHQVTVGPAGKAFDESLQITAPDLERLMKDLLMEAKASKGTP